LRHRKAPFHHLFCISSAFAEISSAFAEISSVLVEISSELVQISSELVSISTEPLIISVFQKIHHIGLQPAGFALKVSKDTFVLFFAHLGNLLEPLRTRHKRQ